MNVNKKLLTCAWIERDKFFLKLGIDALYILSCSRICHSVGNEINSNLRDPAKL